MQIKSMRQFAIGLVGLLAAAGGSALWSPPGPSIAHAAELEKADIAYDLPVLGKVEVFRPNGNPRGLVILLSDAGGWTGADSILADRLSTAGALVTGVSTPAFLRSLDQQKGCVNSNYALIDLARDIQHRMKLPTYMKPVLMGRGMGASLAYATLAAGPDGAYRGVVTTGFSTALPTKAHWCKSGTLALSPQTRGHHGWRIAPAKSLPSSWVTLEPANRSTALAPFLASGRGGRLIPIDPALDTAGQLASATIPFLMPVRPPQRPASRDVPLPDDLPITLVTDPTAPRSDMMAVLYSGDGGWVGLDKDVAAQLAKAGVPVVGIDSLSYFWSARTPASAAADLDAIIRAYASHWRRPKVMLVGYSFGADVLPYIYAHLPQQTRARVPAMALMGLSPNADFQFHLSSWLNVEADDAYPTIPAITRLRGLPMLCIKGQAETDSACPSIPGNVAQVVTVPGGHHFDRNAPLLARLILSRQTWGRLPR